MNSVKNLTTQISDAIILFNYCIAGNLVHPLEKIESVQIIFQNSKLFSVAGRET